MVKNEGLEMEEDNQSKIERGFEKSTFQNHFQRLAQVQPLFVNKGLFFLLALRHK
jgi:hypothetical protein